MASPDKIIRIGGASGYWGDSQDAPRQLVLKGDIDYLVFDYLAEVTMSILVRAREKDPEAGYARDFVDLVMKPLLSEIKARKIKVIANAGGVNIQACAAALKKLSEDCGVDLKIAIVEGDDISGQIEDLRSEGIHDMFSSAALPEQLISANAYLGAFPIAAALDGGADVVITGRCVDSAVTLGPLIHEFGWTADDYDKLAAGSLAGHIIECGAQATGGNFTDWRDVVDGWDDMGYPIAECRGDGQFTITKPEKTGGLVSALTVGEQILYEVGDPTAYIMPDVICDFSNVRLEQTGENRLTVSGVKGLPPTPTYKVSATYRDGYRATAMTVITGFDAVEKGQHFGEALLKRTRRLFRERNLGDYRDTAIHLIGAETLWGDNAQAAAAKAREITTRIDVRHSERAALTLFSKETTGVGLSMTTGRAPGGVAGRPKITPVVAQFSFLIRKDSVPVRATIDGVLQKTPAPPTAWTTQPATGTDFEMSPPSDMSDWSSVPLIVLAVARSGDKGDNANIGVIAREPGYLPFILQAITASSVTDWFKHTVKGEVTRYAVPSMNAVNFLLTRTLGGGGTSSLHVDSQAKTYGQQILTMPVPVPSELAIALREKAS